jgi:hypothetical protein
MRAALFLLSALAVAAPVTGVALAQSGSSSATPVTVATNTAPPPARNVRPTDDPDQRVRCRSIQATGSLVRRERVCRTVAEWRRISQSGNDRARDVVGTGTVCSGGQCGNGN